MKSTSKIKVSLVYSQLEGKRILEEVDNHKYRSSALKGITNLISDRHLYTMGYTKGDTSLTSHSLRHLGLPA